MTDLQKKMIADLGLQNKDFGVNDVPANNDGVTIGDLIEYVNLLTQLVLKKGDKQ